MSLGMHEVARRRGVESFLLLMSPEVKEVARRKDAASFSSWDARGREEKKCGILLAPDVSRGERCREEKRCSILPAPDVSRNEKEIARRRGAASFLLLGCTWSRGEEVQHPSRGERGREKKRCGILPAPDVKRSRGEEV